MPLDTSRMVPRGHLMSVDIKQYADLLLGAMTDQAVTLANALNLGSYIQQLQITRPANPPAGRMKLYPKADGLFYKLDSFGVEEPLGSGGGGGGATVAHEEFKPANTITTVTLSQAAAVVLTVARDGVVQSEVDGHYSYAGTVITFSNAFNGNERVVVAYASENGTGGGDTALRAYIQTIMQILDPGGPPPP